MKTTIDIPDNVFRRLLALTGAKTKRDAILTAVDEFNRRHEVDAMIASFGTWKMDTNDEIEAADREEIRKSR